MIHAPIAGSIINPPARLFKRFTPSEEITVGGNIIIYEKNYYITHYRFRYVEATERANGEHQPIGGLITPDGYMTIKFNGRYGSMPGAVDEPEHDDLVELYGELWVVNEIQKYRLKFLKNMAVIYLTLRRTM